MTRKYTLITGASAGIGRELAVACAKRGFNLLLVALPETGLAALANQLQEQYGVLADYLEADLANPAAARQVYQWCEQGGYAVDKLINNVGVGSHQLFQDCSPEEIQLMIQLNTCVVASILNLFIPMLQKQGKAYVLNVSSTASFFNIPNKALYAATKAFVNTLSTSLRNELTGTPVSVSVVCPGGSTHKINAQVEQKIGKTFSDWIHETPRTIAEAGVKGMLQGKRMIVPGGVAKLYVLTSKVLPVSLADLLVRSLFSASATVSGVGATRRFEIRWPVVVTIVASLLMIAAVYLFHKAPLQPPAKGASPDSLKTADLKNKPSVAAGTTLPHQSAYLLKGDCHVYAYNLGKQGWEAKVPLNVKGNFQGFAFVGGAFYLLGDDGSKLILHPKNRNAYVIAADVIPFQVPHHLDDLSMNKPHQHTGERAWGK